MDDERNVFDEVYEEAVANLADLQPGSEEFERQAKAIAEMDKARSEKMRAEADVSNRKGQFWLGVVQAGVAALGVAASIFGIAMQRRTNKDVMHFEEEDVITSKAFDNKSKFR